jgi:hypothetical protein
MSFSRLNNIICGMILRERPRVFVTPKSRGANFSIESHNQQVPSTLEQSLVWRPTTKKLSILERSFDAKKRN